MKKLVFLLFGLWPVWLHGVRQRPRTDKARSPLSRRHLGANCVELSLHRRTPLPFHPGDCAGRNDLSRAGVPRSVEDRTKKEYNEQDVDKVAHLVFRATVHGDTLNRHKKELETLARQLHALTLPTMAPRRCSAE